MGKNSFRIAINTQLHKFAKLYMMDLMYDPEDILHLAEEWFLFRYVPRDSFLEDMEGYIQWYDIRGGQQIIGDKMKNNHHKRGRLSNSSRFISRTNELSVLGYVLIGTIFKHPNGHLLDRDDVYHAKKADYLRLLERCKASVGIEAGKSGKTIGAGGDDGDSEPASTLRITPEDIKEAEMEFHECRKRLEEAKKAIRKAKMNLQMTRMYFQMQKNV